MSDKEFLERFMYEVHQMRLSQQNYFRSRSDTNLKSAKNQEHKVDTMYTRLLKRGFQPQAEPITPDQQNLFNTTGLI
jgi:hypothetical protein